MSALPIGSASPRQLDAELSLLDHQIASPDGQLVGKVDDLALTDDGRTLQVSYLMVGAEALGHRLPGKLGTWTLAIWRRLNPALDPAPTCVPLADVLDVASAVTVTPERATALQAGFGLELWLQHHVVDRIPGGFTEPDTDAADTVDDTRPDLASAIGQGPVVQHRISELLGAHVHDAAGTDVGQVVDVRLSSLHGHISSGLVVDGLLVARRRTGTALGYFQDRDQGPLLLGTAVRALHRDAHYTPWSDLRSVDWSDRAVRLRR